MEEWRIETVPVHQNDEILTTHIDCRKDGMWYVINGADGYDLSMWTPEKAEEDYMSPEEREARTVAFMQANGFFD